MENDALGPSTSEKSKILSQEQPSNEPPRKKRKGPKGPNPLSVKKKKPKVSTQPIAGKKDADTSRAGEKRQRDDEEHQTAPEDRPNPEGSGHKRKRRRKGKEGTDTAAASEAND